MKKLFKFIIFTVALCTVFALAAATVFADDPTSGSFDGYYWYIDNNILYIEGNGPMTDYFDDDDFPWSDWQDDIKGIVVKYGITHIAAHAFEDMKHVSDRVEIADSVTSIGYCAFYNLGVREDGGVDLVIPESVQSIDKWAFYDADCLSNVWIKGSPSGELSIGEGAFKESDYIVTLALGTVENREQKIKLGKESFSETDSLVHIFMSPAVTEIGKEAFYDPDSLLNVYYLGTEDQWDDIAIDTGNDDMTGIDRKYFDDIFSCYCDESGYWLVTKIWWAYIYAPFNFPDQTAKFSHNQNGHDEYTHWSKYPNGNDAILSNGKKAAESAHTIINGVCSCGVAHDPFSYVDENGKNCSISSGVTFLHNDTTTLENGWYVCTGEFDYGERRLQVKGDVKLILLNRKGFKTSSGIHINDNASLTIYSETLDPSEGNSMGYITVTYAPGGCAGIGTDNWGTNSDNNRVVICGGNIDCYGGDGAAGIGSGSGSGKVSVTIYNGHVSAVGGMKINNGGGAGIGSGHGANCDAKVVIWDGIIYASSREYGAGIGSGSYGANCHVELRGGKITAETSGDGAPIGSGLGRIGLDERASNCTVDIFGGDFDLHSRLYEKTIGAGQASNCTVNDHRGGGSILSNGSLIVVSIVSIAAIAVVVVFVKKKQPQNMA